MSTISVDVSSTRIPVLQVGYQGENEVTDVYFDVSSWITDYGEGTAQLKVKRPQNSEEESYTLSLPISGGIATWTVTDTDTANKGNGKVQLLYTVSGALKKSVIYPYKVGKSLVSADNPVDPFDTWIERSKAWATGKDLDGEDVSETDEAYHNNALYFVNKSQEYSIESEGYSKDAEAWAKGTRDGVSVEEDDETYEKNAKYYADEASVSAGKAAESETNTQAMVSPLNSRMGAIEIEQAAQDARMDTFTTLAEGSTTGDAELADIRVGANGKTYPNAGDAVRGQVSDLKSDLNKTVVFNGELKPDFVANYFIKTAFEIGTTVDTTPTYNAGFAYYMEQCKAGDTYTLTGSGGGNPRLWAFLDVDKKVRSLSLGDVTENNKTLTASADGYLIVNVVKSQTYSLIKKMFKDVPDNAMIADIYSALSTYSKGDICIYNNALYKCETDISTAEAWTEAHWSIIDIAEELENKVEKDKIQYFLSDEFEKPAGSNYIHNYPFEFVAGAKYEIKNTSVSRAGTAMNFFTRETADGANLETIVTTMYETSPFNPYIFTPTQDAHFLRVVANYDGRFEIKRIDAVEAQIEQVYTDIETAPMVKFEFDHDLKDISAYNALMDWTNKYAQADVLEQIYDLYDGLVSTYPSYVSRVDLAEELEISYPAYANGNYDSTPAYKTYMYKFIDNNTYIGNSDSGNNKKKNLLIVTGLHGNEIAAPFNAYVFMRELCEKFIEDANFFKFRSAFNVYVVPCLNGYGMYNLTRGNGNKVNLNRNFPIYGWEVYGADTMDSPTANEYTGATAGSEFETQLIMGLVNSVNFDMVIDHHNYSVLDFAFYSDVCHKHLLKLTYQSAADCSYAFKKHLPAWFGNGFDILVHRTGAAPGSTELKLYGTTSNWCDQNGVPFSATVEISECINYVNGIYDGSHRNDNFGNDTFSVGEYTLRNQLFRYGEWVLKNVK